MAFWSSVLLVASNVVAATIIGLFIWVASRQVRQKSYGVGDVLEEEEEEEENTRGGGGGAMRESSGRLLRRRYSQELFKCDTEDDEEGDEFDFDPAPLTDAPALQTGFSEMFDNNAAEESRQSFLSVVSKIKMFSYLNEAALMECLKFVEFVDVAEGEALFGKGALDGSLYAVVTGCICCNFDLDHLHLSTTGEGGEGAVGGDSFSLSFGPGDVITTLLTVLAALIDPSPDPASSELMLRITGGVSAVATVDTRVIKVPVQCFKSVQKKFPADVYRIAQTVIVRMTRVTVSTLTRFLGLSKEILVRERQELVEGGVEHLEKLEEELALGHAAKLAACQLGIPDSADSLMDGSRIVHVRSGECVVRAGEIPEAVFLVLRGALDVSMQVAAAGADRSRRPSFSSLRREGSQQHQHQPPQRRRQHTEVRLSKYGPGAFVGKLSCFTAEVSGVTARAEGDAVLMRIPKSVFDGVMIEYPRAMSTFVATMLSLLSPVVYLLDWGLEWQHFQASETVVRQDTECDSLFVVINGRLRAARSHNDDAVEEYGRGSSIGAVEILTDGCWPNDIFAIRDAETARVPKRLLEAVLSLYPHSALHFSKVIAKRTQARMVSALGGSDRRGNLTLATIAVVPLSSAVNVPEFTVALTEALGRIAPTQTVTKRMAKKHLGDMYGQQTALRQLKMARFLGDIEEVNRIVVYPADQRYTRWTKTCVRQADCVLLVVNRNEVPTGKSVRHIEQSLQMAFRSMRVRIELVVLVPAPMTGDESDFDERIPANDRLNDWSEKRAYIKRHHTIRDALDTQHTRDFDRMCRRITGLSIGLVLGGGGARGLAHIGVIRALEEAGVRVDMVGGTSQGAFIGALYAKHPDRYSNLMRESRAMASEMSNVKNKLLDLTLPLTSFFSAHRFNAGIERLLGKTRIQDLVLNFFCVSTDILNSAEVVHTKGLLWKYVRASMSLQGYLPPVSEAGSMLLDGGYMNVLPADVMLRQFGAKTVIAVDVGSEPKRGYFEYGPELNGWWLLWNRINPFTETVKVPSMGDISRALSFVNSQKNRDVNRGIIDLYLKPPVEKFSTLEFDKFDEIVRIGYEYAKPIVDDWVAEHPWFAEK